MNRELTQRAAMGVSYIRDGTRAFGLFVGAICLNAIDVLIGGLIISQVFREADFWFGSPWDGLLVGYTIGMAILFAQYVLWDTILKGGITPRDIFGIVLATTVAIGDVLIDITPVGMWLEQSWLRPTLESMPSLFGAGISLYEMFRNALTVSLLTLLGFGELLTVLYLRTANISTSNSPRPFGRNVRRGERQAAYTGGEQ